MHVATMDDATCAFYHALAILHAPDYRKENSGALRQDWPRIPLPDSKELLAASAELGKQIAALLDTERDVGAIHELPYKE
jgi:predicted helicase